MKIVFDALIDDLIRLENSTISDITTYTNVFLNGKLIGLHRKPSLLQKYMKLLKLNSFINITTSISWNIKTNDFHVFKIQEELLDQYFS